MKSPTQTLPSKFVGVVRIMLGIVFAMTGVMKLAMTDFGAAWSVQLIEAKIPFYTFTYWFVPILEIFLGVILLIGYFSRIGALIILPVMLVAIFVHLTVTNRAAFPAQPQEPFVPIIVIIMALIIIVKGGGKWSRDLRVSQTVQNKE